ncbi:MAG: glycosyltransferase family 4 protein [Bacillota bacterium]|jgi:glycogen(starch) synthase
MTWRVLMLAWEYPPHHVGGLGRHVGHLSRALLERGAEVTVITRSVSGETETRDDEGVRVVSAAPFHLHPPDFVTWAAQFNVSLMEAATREMSSRRFDLVHAHDWIVAYAAKAIKEVWEIPLIATIHATEFGRQGGIHNPMQAHISETEWWLCYESLRVIVCSRYMRAEVGTVFRVPRDKLRVIPNGIDSSWFMVQRRKAREPLIIYVGRLVVEKGPLVLVDAMAHVAKAFPDARLVFAGSGPLEGEMSSRIAEMGLEGRVRLAGHLNDRELKDLYSKAWVAAFPSSYEPFGIVALEAMATGVPCIVGNTGGLREVVSAGETGLVVEPNNPIVLADAIARLISNPDRAEAMAARAKRVALSEYSWSDIAGKTVAVYDEVLRNRVIADKFLEASRVRYGAKTGATT